MLVKFKRAKNRENLKMVGVAAAIAGASLFQPTQAAEVSVAQAQKFAVNPNRVLQFEVFLPLRDEEGLQALIEEQQDPTSVFYHQWLTPKSFAERFGPTTQSIAKVKSALQASGLKVDAVHSRSLHVVANAGAVQRGFNTQLNSVVESDGSERLISANGLRMPSALVEAQAVIPAFIQTHKLHVTSLNMGRMDPNNRYGKFGAYWYNDLKQAYDYPSYLTQVGGHRLDGTGTNVAIVMSSDVLDSDIQQIFDHEHFSTTAGVPDPVLAGRVYVNGGSPIPFAKNGAAGEASLDVQQVLGGAPGAAVTLVDIPDLSDASIIAGYTTIVESNSWDIVNSSFGGCELGYSAAYNGGQNYYGVLKTYNTLFAQGNSQGITFVASSGDEGGLECPDVSYFSGDPNATPQFVPSVSFPASSPHVTSVGGTNLVTTKPPVPQTVPPKLTSAYVKENAAGDPEVPYDPYGLGLNVSGGYWGAGGGVSDYFAAPDYQSQVNTRSSMRTVPDVGMQVGGCPGLAVSPCANARSAVVTAIGGGLFALIGTSVASPEFVSVLALDVQVSGGRLGNVNKFLYRKASQQDDAGGYNAPANSQFYHQDIPGFDGYYHTNYQNQSYNYITGNGTPDVRLLLGLKKTAAAGDPQSPSNP